MIRYETLVLTAPEITADESSALEKSVEQIVSKARGKMISFERWGKYKLAYPIWSNEYGVYFLSRFEVDENASLGELNNEIHTLATVKLPQLVMRYMTTRLNADQSLTYQKPESLEDTPVQDVDTFIRENKMEGFLNTVSGRDKESGRASGRAEEVFEEDTDETAEDEA